MSLIEVVVFIVVVGIALAGAVLLFNQVTRASVDPMIRKQALALATSMLEEIQLHAFTYCEPDDPAVYTAADATACAIQEGIGAEGGETRNPSPSTNPRFDNVSDYNNFRMGSGQVEANIRTADGQVISALADYSVVVSVAAIGLNELGGSIPAAEGLRISVTATHAPTGTTVQLDGYRTRYAPNSP